MPMPSRLKIGSYTFTLCPITVEQADALAIHGQADMTALRIDLCLERPAEIVANTFLHEVIHCIHWVYGLDTGSEEEAFTCLTTNGLMAFMRDNPGAWRWFQRLSREKL